MGAPALADRRPRTLRLDAGVDGRETSHMRPVDFSSRRWDGRKRDPAIMTADFLSRRWDFESAFVFASAKRPSAAVVGRGAPPLTGGIAARPEATQLTGRAQALK